MKLYEAGRLNKTITTFIEKERPPAGAGVRRPARPACGLPHRRETVRRDRGALRAGADQAISRKSSTMRSGWTRAALAELPDGEWSFEDWIDDDGIDYGQPIRLFVTIRKQGDHMVVDGPAPTRRSRRDQQHALLHQGGGLYRRALGAAGRHPQQRRRVPRHRGDSCPPGTVGNGVLPAACAARGLTGFRMVDCMFGALAMMLPDKVKAAGDGGNTGISIGGYDPAQAVRLCRLTCGAWGARPWPTASTAPRTCSPTWPRTRRGHRGRASDPAHRL